MKMYTVYDSKGEFYMQPMFFRTDAEAIRVFSDACQNKDHQFAHHPEDFSLMRIGAWDELTSEIKLQPANVSITNGLACQRIEGVDNAPIIN